MDASMGVMAEGIGRFCAPFKASTTEATETTEAGFVRCPLFAGAAVTLPFFLLLFSFGIEGGSALRAVAATFFLFFSTLARLSASHAAFNLPPDALLLLFHSAESSSPAL